MAAIVVPFAFLARDQLDYGLLPGEQTVMIALFGASLVILVSFGGAPIGALIMITLLSVILRRAILSCRELAPGFREDFPRGSHT
jgi:hypothetical protein